MATQPSARLDFIFESAARTNKTDLLQGDLLHRTPAMAAVLRQAHAYYADASDYSHFLVLTQSCDLVRRKGQCKSRYITVCAVRPLALAVEREFEKYVQPLDGFPLRVGRLQDSILARQFLERVLNNTVDGIFFIPNAACPTVDEHLCAFLPLSIALRADHYETCLAAKVGQATEIFAAKIGALTSGLYGRIATPDLAEKYGAKAATSYRDKFYDDLGVKSVAWLTNYQRQELERMVAEHLSTEPNKSIEPSVAQTILTGLPSEVEALAARAVEVLTGRKLIADDPDSQRKARNFLLNDGQFAKLARRSIT